MPRVITLIYDTGDQVGSEGPTTCVHVRTPGHVHSRRYWYDRAQGKHGMEGWGEFSVHDGAVLVHWRWRQTHASPGSLRSWVG